MSNLSLKVYSLCSVFLTGVATLATAIKFLFDSGNIESGEITMFGVVNS